MFTWVVAAALALSGPAPAGPDAAAQLMTLPPALQAELNDTVLAGHPSQPQRLRRLVNFVFDAEGLGVTYAEDATYSVEQAYATRRANCLAFTMLFLALAREAGLDAFPQELGATVSWRESEGTIYRDNHINVGIRIAGRTHTVDVAGNSLISLHPPVRISDQRLLAHYYNNLAAGRFEHGEAAAAQQYITMALALDPTYAPHWSNAGVMYLRGGDADAAERAYSKALAIDAMNASALFNMVGLMRRKGDLREADFRLRLANVQQNDPLQQFLQARDYERIGDYARAIERYRRAIQLHRNEHRFYSALARAYVRSGDTPRANRALIRAQALSDGATRAAYRAQRDSLKRASN